MSTVEELSSLIAAKGEEIRVLKAAKADKEAITAQVNQLLVLKEQYKVANNGIPFDAPKAPEPKKEKPAPLPEPPAREGPSKKELNKMARKAGKAEGKAAAREEKAQGDEAASDAPAAAAKPVAAAKPAAAAAPALDVGTVSVVFSKGHEAKFSELVVTVLGDAVTFAPSTAAAAHEPYAQCNLGSVSGDHNVGRFIARRSSSRDLYFSSNAWLASQVDQWLGFVASAPELNGALDLLNGHLSNKTFAVGDSLSLADIALYVFMSGHAKTLTAPANADRFKNVARWHALIAASVVPPKAVKGAKAGAAAAAPAEGAKKGGSATAAAAAKKEVAAEEGGGCPPLEDAVMGEVVTRFPPEPSGYLHIGHAKAVLLNQYYAQRYSGKLIVRFDDTNPSKEKDEFEENIIQDLATLKVKADIVSHTSDHFETCEKFARQMITEGLAYMDDTPQEEMQAERMAMQESKRRNTSPEENMRLFNELLLGSPDATKYCLRAKIDMKSVNGTLRDPVLYRFNATPHHRTGTRYKAYPTYDFACPIVDSVEGVTHALRTTEYNDRDEQYRWLQNAMRLRSVNIWAYGKVNFVNTVLSKRKLNWFVENKLVDGWFDPRFPTIQGCIRRGMSVDALKNFIINQGASRRVITMEWDKFWSDNKKILEETSHRYMSVSASTSVKFTVTNVPAGESAATVQLHPSKPEMGTRVMRRSNELLLEREDCNTFAVGEEVTVLRWGNFFIDSIERDANNNVVSMTGRFNPDATNFSKTKKATWLANTPDLVPCTFVEFDHLISKAKLTDDENFQDFLTPVTRAETSALADPCIRSVHEGQVVQFERKGFFRCDRAYGGSADKPAVFFLIPDGKMKAMSTLASALGHK